MFYDINGTLVEPKAVEASFCCDLPTCKGACCVLGELGAPVTATDIEAIEQLLPTLLPLMPELSRKTIEGTNIYDEVNGELFLKTVGGRECVFVKFDSNGVATCLIEHLYENRGRTGYQKPLSCALFPIRIRKRFGLPLLTYEEAPFCEAGRQNGLRQNISLMTFLKKPLSNILGNTRSKD